jgi:transcriptional regulator of acetoin/glycerol metabolism
MGLTDIPFDRRSQRSLERLWHATVQDHRPPDEIRPVVRSSWERCLSARVRPDLPAAPIVWDEGQLLAVVERHDWLGLARQAVIRHQGSFSGVGHILTLFDHQARMLAAEGDPAALEGLGEINFRPGGLWAEAVVGTNGPGTALATGQPTHIVGAEHFCARWHPWHCAAVPVRDPATGEILGVLDISGFREYAHPHTLNLALALVVAIEQSLAARETERRYLTLSRLTELTLRYPGDASLAVDRTGRVLCASPAAPPAFSPGRDHPGLRAAVPALVERTADPTPREVALPLGPEQAQRGVWYPVFDGHTVVGGCLLLQPGPARPAARRPTRGGKPWSVRYSFDDVCGDSPALARARETALAAARTDLPVLLMGESGTGKEVFAQAIHGASARSDRPFVPVNCAALPRELIESELFGYEGGAFTGARREGTIGKFEAAEGGTLFLDEIVELPAAAQAALLRALQEGEIIRVGGVQSRPLDVRIIAATNRDIPAALSSGALRADLYYRLSVIPIELPPLRARPGDVGRLARRFFEAAAREQGLIEVAVDGEVYDAFAAYSWPGNIRELQNVIRRLVAVTGAVVRVADLPQAIRAAWLGMTTPRPSHALSPPPDRPNRIDEEDAHLIQVVNSSATMAEAAARLGITRSTLYRRMARFGLRPRRVVGR